MPKNQRLVTFKKHFILLLAVLYVVAPLKNVLLGGVHEIAHAFSQTSAKHSHQLAHDHDEEHTHDHRIVSFFSTLFSSESDAETSDKIVPQFDVDKHFVQENEAEQLPLKPFRIAVYFYTSEKYTTSLQHTTPPPQGLFS